MKQVNISTISLKFLNIVLCVNKLSIVGSVNGLSPVQHQAIVLANDEMLNYCQTNP